VRGTANEGLTPPAQAVFRRCVF